MKHNLMTKWQKELSKVVFFTQCRLNDAGRHNTDSIKNTEITSGLRDISERY